MFDWVIGGLGDLFGFGLNAIGEAVGWAWDKVVTGIYTWLANGLALLVEWVWSVLDSGTTPRVTAGWFANDLAVQLGVLALAVTVAMMLASVCLVMLDVVGGLPFLMSVKPSERTEMSAVYSSFRDVSSVLTPGLAWLVLAVAPTAAIFAACGLAMVGAWRIAGELHPRLGVPRPSRGRVPAE